MRHTAINSMVKILRIPWFSSFRKEHDVSSNYLSTQQRGFLFTVVEIVSSQRALYKHKIYEQEETTIEQQPYLQPSQNQVLPGNLKTLYVNGRWNFAFDSS